MIIPCISLHLPWAMWIPWGWKKIETRRHRKFACLEGRRIGIHAAHKWDISALDLARPWLSWEQIYETMNKIQRKEPRPYGVVCTAMVTRFLPELVPEHSSGALCPCTAELSGLLLSGIEILDRPINIPGGRGIFYADLEQP